METNAKKKELWVGDSERQQDSLTESVWTLVQTLVKWRKMIVITTTVTAIGAIVVSLLLPKWYQGTAKVLLPESGGSGLLTSMLDELGPAAAAFMGSSGGDYVRYRAILNSSTVMRSVIDEFNLRSVYDIEDEPMDDVIEALRENVEFVVDDEFQFMAVEVLDRDPTSAAAMANFFVAELNRRNAELLSQDAASYKAYLQISLRETEANLDSARTALQVFQETNGIIDLPMQAEAMMTNLAEIRASVFESEIRAEVLAQQYGTDNAQARVAMDGAAAANRKYAQFLEGSDKLLPVAQDSLPAIGKEYAQLVQEVLIQGKILEYVRPLFEQARLDEQREKTAVLVLDPATVPFYKTKPQRSIIVIVATMSGFILAVLFALAFEWYRRNRRQIEARLSQFDA
ncbi:MAG: lipopolysaccharide biosynthesis protein [Rhodothermales bacterium]|nr:lipopolysaccharide biosynthesis protein [Rhodothermales bacterium]